VSAFRMPESRSLRDSNIEYLFAHFNVYACFPRKTGDHFFARMRDIHFSTHAFREKPETTFSLACVTPQSQTRPRAQRAVGRRPPASWTGRRLKDENVDE
jgi:hypothetical protein